MPFSVLHKEKTYIYKGLDEQYRAAHAGDDGSRNTVSKFSWIDTPVEVLDTDPEFPIVTITKDATFAINGRDTGVKVPVETKYGRGYVTDSKWLNDQGIGVNVTSGSSSSADLIYQAFEPSAPKISETRLMVSVVQTGFLQSSQ